MGTQRFEGEEEMPRAGMRSSTTDFSFASRLPAPATEYEQHHNDNQNYAERSNSTAHAVVGIPVVASAETAKEEQQNNNNQDCIHDGSPCDYDHRELLGSPDRL